MDLKNKIRAVAISAAPMVLGLVKAENDVDGEYGGFPGLIGRGLNVASRGLDGATTGAYTAGQTWMYIVILGLLVGMVVLYKRATHKVKGR